MSTNDTKRTRSSQPLLLAIAEAQENYDRRYRELVGPDTDWRNEDDLAASWLTVLRGAPAARALAN